MIDIAIIGGGPAGLAAGLYAARGGANTVLYEALFPGGQAVNTPMVENYPGFPDGIAGSELSLLLEKQAKKFGLKIQSGPVDQAVLEGAEKRLILRKETQTARAVILAMGARPRKLSLPREEELTGSGVSYCAICDGAFFKNQEVAVVGGGDTALSDALYLSRFAGKVYLIHRRGALRGGATLQRAVLAEEKIEVVWDTVVRGLLGGGALEALQIKNIHSGEEKSLSVRAVFAAIGIEPNSELINGQFPLAEGGYIQTDAAMRTGLAGVFAAGDIRKTPLRQIVTAVADGAVAATSALDYLTHKS